MLPIALADDVNTSANESAAEGQLNISLGMLANFAILVFLCLILALLGANSEGGRKRAQTHGAPGRFKNKHFFGAAKKNYRTAKRTYNKSKKTYKTAKNTYGKAKFIGGKIKILINKRKEAKKVF
jgi:hypothetical protein